MDADKTTANKLLGKISYSSNSHHLILQRSYFENVNKIPSPKSVYAGSGSDFVHFLHGMAVTSNLKALAKSCKKLKLFVI